MDYKKYSYLFIVLFVLGCNQVLALNLNYEAGVQYETASNIALVPESITTSPPEEKIQTTFLNMTLNEDTGIVRANVLSNLNYLNYQNDVYQDEALNSLSAEVFWEISPRRYSWYLLDRYTQTAIDSLQSVSVTNRQNVNEFVSGPDFVWQLSRVDSLTLNARVHSYDYDENIYDNERLSSGLQWTKHLASNLSINLHYDALVVEYKDDVANTNFDRNTATFGVTYNKNPDQLTANIGASRVQDQNNDAYTDDYYSLIYIRRISNRSELTLTYNHGLADRSNDLQTGLSNVNGNYLEINSSILYRRTMSSLQWSVMYQEIKREGIMQDDIENEDSVALDISKALSARTFLTMHYDKIKFGYLTTAVSPVDDELSTTTIGIRHQISRHLNVLVGADQLDRQSDDVNRVYSDKRIRVGITYRS